MTLEQKEKQRECQKRYEQSVDIKAKWREYSKSQREKNRGNPEYKKRRALSEKKSRERHVFRKLAKLYRKNSTRKGQVMHEITAIDFWRLARIQKLICPLTGEKLTNENISIDHKIPLYRGGVNTLDNLRLVTKWANIAKNSLLDTEFFEACERVALVKRVGIGALL